MQYGEPEGAFRAVVTAGWGVKSSGDVEAPTGHFAVVEIPEHAGERAEMRAAVFDGDAEAAEGFDCLDAGWYLVTEDSNGNVSYSRDSQVWVNRRFDELDAAYALWLDR